MTAERLHRLTIRRGPSDRDVVLYPKPAGISDWAQCGLRVRLSAYDGRWRLWLVALDGTTIAGPRRLVPGIDLLLGLKHDSRAPQGQLFCYSKDREPPTVETLDTAAVLFYRGAS